MALILKDRVKESSSSSGTGNITLGGAFPGYQTFNAAIASGSTVYYTIHNLTAGFDTEWEVGVGTFTSPATLARNTVLSSSNSGSLVPFTSGVSGLEVFVTQPSEEAVYLNQATGLVEVGGNGTNTVAFTNINASNVVMVSGTISTNAANATDITNKQYVDGLFSQGVSYHQAVLVESPTALNAVYVQPNGAGNGVGATLTNNGANAALVIDGVTLSNTARVLVYTQSNAVHNGVYTVTNPGAPDPGGTQWVLTRATDADTFGLANPNTLGAGDAFFVQSGNTGAGETYVCTTAGTITFGSSNITFAQISSAQIYAAGTGLNLSNLTFSIANTAVTAATYGAANAVGTFTVNAQGQITNAANTTISIASNQINDAIPNSGLANSNVVVNGTTINLGGSGTITANTTGTLTIGSYLTGGSFNGGSNVTVAVDGNSSNSANTVVVRDANGAFAGGNITAANFIGAGTTITSINASNISSGTIANARTTAASANGASTIVQRDAGGNFSANTITANISGDISGGTNINASNITSGTINNARTTASSANGASTIVLRDTNGSFDANVVNATNLSGGGTSITSINASNLSAGTVASARVSGSYTGITGVGTLTAGTWNANTIANLYTTANSANGASTIVARDAGGNFSANTITATTFSGAFSGNGSALTAINASNISSGTVVVSYGGTGLNSVTANCVPYGNGTSALQVTSNFTYNGTFINSGGGTIQYSPKIGVRFAGNNYEFGHTNTAGYGSTLGAETGSGAPFIGFNTGAGTTGNTYKTLGLAGTVIRGDNAGGLGFYTVSNANADNQSLTTLATLNSSGTLAATTFSGSGASLTTINASNISSGTVATARLATGTADSSTYLRGDQTWATVTSGITLTDDTTTNATRYPILTASTSGSISTANVSSTKLTYNPSTGTLSATVQTASSDVRLKDDITVIPNALDKVIQIRGVTYVRNDVPIKSRHAGVIAQEVEKVLPEVIGTDADGYKVVAYGNMIGLLVEAIKELKAEVDALKGK